MKRLLLAISILLSLRLCAQVTTTCVPSWQMREAYQNDAKYLALQRLYLLHSADTQQIEIPQQYSDSIINALAAICNLGTTYEADSVFLRYCIHEYNISYSFTAQVDTSYPWTHAWAALNTTTGDTDIDNFMQLHGMRVTNYFNGSSYAYLNNRATLTCDHVINLKAFADSLRLFSGINYTDNSAYLVGDGNHISYTTDTNKQFVFTLAWGDCPAGCNNRVRWTYTVSDTCTVDLISKAVNVFAPGSPPMPLCNSFPVAVEDIQHAMEVKVFPNPATDVLTLEMPGYTAENDYQIISLLGKTLLTGKLYNRITIDIRELPAGQYILRLRATNTRFTKY
jgi:hypothetical protein